MKTMMILKFIPFPLSLSFLLCACSTHPPVQNTAENTPTENNTATSANTEENTNNSQKLDKNTNTQPRETNAINDQAKVEENSHSQLNIKEDSGSRFQNENVAEIEANIAENSNTPILNTHANDDHANDEQLVQCEVRLDVNGELYTAQATGPTLEEARDNAIDESCSIPCAESIDANLSEDEAEDKIIACAQSCADHAIIIAALCSQFHTVIYSEGAWEHNDSSSLSD